MLAGVVGSALLLGLYARGGNAYVLGFVALVPWLLALDAQDSIGRVLLGGLAMSVAFVAAAFGWFGIAIGEFTELGDAGGLLVSWLAAPLLQPQLLAFALVRHWVGRGRGEWLRAGAGACAWVACEWALPKLLGDTLGHGLYPSLPLRQFADVGGAAGLTVLLLLANEAIAMAIRRRRAGTSRWQRPLGALAILLVAWLGYGSWRAAQAVVPAAEATPLRVGMVQTNIVDYERLRRERGAYAVVREVLDTHFAMSREAVSRQQADALLWSETVYPTTYGHAKSTDGAALDDEIRTFATATRVPLVFGTYDVDAAGEYNAAAFLAADGGLLGMYRKRNPFPLTEHVPRWLDGERLRRWLPWTGHWQAGDGARVFPLRLADGREIPVQPLICLDDVDTTLALDGARLGAQAILGMSNDSWFSTHRQGAELHLAVAAFRSIETRLPQFRVTANGISAAIDPAGTRIATTAIGEPAVLTVAMPVGTPRRTLMVAWGNWVGPAALVALLAIGANAAWTRWSRRRPPIALHGADATVLPRSFEVLLLTPAWRTLLAGLQLVVVATLAWLGLRMLLRDGLQVYSIVQLQWFALGVVLPAAVAGVVRRRLRTTARVDGGALRLERRGAGHDQAVPLVAPATCVPWRLPVPMPGVTLRGSAGARVDLGMLGDGSDGLSAALAGAGCPAGGRGRAAAFAIADARARAGVRRWRIETPWVKFGLFPLLLALPAFRLHQHIAYGGTFGEVHSFGVLAWLLGLLIWWAAWAIGMTLFATLLRTGVELGSLAALALRPDASARIRTRLHAVARALYFVGAPAWLAWRLLAA